MIDNFNKKGMFDNHPIEGMPDELYEVAYRYATIELERDCGRSLAVESGRKRDFKGFIIYRITWRETLEGCPFWAELHNGLYRPELSLISLDNLKHFIDFKHYD